MHSCHYGKKMFKHRFWLLTPPYTYPRPHSIQCMSRLSPHFHVLLVWLGYWEPLAASAVLSIKASDEGALERGAARSAGRGIPEFGYSYLPSGSNVVQL